MREYQYERLIRKYLRGETTEQIASVELNLNATDVRHNLRRGFKAMSVLIPAGLLPGNHGDQCALGPDQRSAILSHIDRRISEREHREHFSP